MWIRNVGIIYKQKLRSCLCKNSTTVLYVHIRVFTLRCPGIFRQLEQQTNAPKDMLSGFLNPVCRCLVWFLGKGICPFARHFSVQKSTTHTQTHTKEIRTQAPIRLRNQHSKVRVVVANSRLKPRSNCSQPLGPTKPRPSLRFAPWTEQG